MGSKKILEEMFELITEKSDESIEESKFNKSILGSIKVKTTKEIDAVLSELLIMLKEGNESIGKISNGYFVCYPNIIKKTEETVLKRLEIETSYVEKDYNNTTETDEIVKENQESKISDLISRYDDLSEEEFGWLFDSIGDMSDEEFTDFLNQKEISEEPWIEAGIKEKTETEAERRKLTLIRYSEGKDKLAADIANLVLSIETESIDPTERERYKSLLEIILKNGELSEDAKKLCSEININELIKKRSIESEQGDKNNKDPKARNIILTEARIRASGEKFDIKKHINEDRTLLQQYKSWLDRINRGEIISEEEAAQFLGTSEGPIVDKTQLSEIIKKTRQKRYTVKLKRERETGKEDTQEEVPITSKLKKELDGTVKVKKSTGIKRRRLHVVRNVGDYENSRRLQEHVEVIPKREKQTIQDHLIDPYYKSFAVDIKVDGNPTLSNIKKGNHEPNEIVARQQPKAITVEKMKILQIQTSKKKEEIKRIVKDKGSMDDLEDASNMIFGLISEMNVPVINELTGSSEPKNKSAINPETNNDELTQ